MSGQLRPKRSEEQKEVRGDVKLVNRGKHIILPEEMEIDEGIEWLYRFKEEQEQEVVVCETIQASPLDGAVALMKVLKERYGWTSLVPRMGFFGPQPPQMIAVPVSPKETIQVPWGNMEIPNISGTVSTGFVFEEFRPLFQLRANVKRKNEKEIKEIADDVRRKVREESIYKCKAIKVSYRDQDGDRIDKFSPSHCPKFLDLTGISEEDLIFPTETHRMVRDALFTPVEFTDRCRQNAIPLKRGVLLEGPFGTGKTLCARVLGQKCEKNKWTYIYLEDVRDLDMALAFARLYEPCVVFAEDVDRAVAGSRTAELDKILNTLDGVDSKKSEIMVVLTTNNSAVINPAFIRPGRIDAVIPILPPDNEAVCRLVRSYAKNSDGNSILDATDEELSVAVSPLEGANAAFIRESVERSKLSAIRREGEFLIKAEDIQTAAIGMARHVDMIDPSAKARRAMEEAHPMDLLMAQVGDFLGTAVLHKMLHPKHIRKAIEKAVSES